MNKNGQTSKRNLSNSSMSPIHEDKKTKKFISPNRYAALYLEDTDSKVTTSPSDCFSDDHIELTITDNDQVDDLPAPPLYIKNIKNYASFNNTLINLTGPNGFTCKSSSQFLIVQPSGRVNFNKITEHLNDTNAEFHSF